MRIDQNVVKKGSHYPKHYPMCTLSDKEIASVSIAWQIVNAISMTSDINVPAVHQKLHDMYDGMTGVLYSNEK